MVKLRERVAAQTQDNTRASHPMLGVGSTYLMIYAWIKNNPGCTRAVVTRQLRVNQQRISDLINAGLIETRGKKGRFALLYAKIENEIGVPRDKVEVMVTIFVNEYGEYSCESKIKSEAPSARMGTLKPVADKTFTVMIPKPKEGYTPRQTFANGPPPPLTTRVMDADYQMVVEPE